MANGLLDAGAQERIRAYGGNPVTPPPQINMGTATAMSPINQSAQPAPQSWFGPPSFMNTPPQGVNSQDWDNVRNVLWKTTLGVGLPALGGFAGGAIGGPFGAQLGRALGGGAAGYMMDPTHPYRNALIGMALGYGAYPAIDGVGYGPQAVVPWNPAMGPLPGR